MKEVVLHVYDVTSSGSETTNNAILQINRICKDRFEFGGVFHSAIQVYGDEEWSFGYCEQGSGVFSCPPSTNDMYTYRERIVLGQTNRSINEVRLILRELSQAWPGQSYELLSKNCNHFCDTFCERLGVPKLPGWVNRFANVGDTAVAVAVHAALRLLQAKEELLTASKVAFRLMSGQASNPNSEGTSESPSDSNRGTSESDVVPIHPQEHSEGAAEPETK